MAGTGEVNKTHVCIDCGKRFQCPSEFSCDASENTLRCGSCFAHEEQLRRRW